MDSPHEAEGRVIIRPARESDVEAFRELRLEGFRNHPEAFAGDYEQNLARPMEYWTDYLKRNADGPNCIIYVAEAGQQLAGMTGIEREDSPKKLHSAWIWGVYVRPQWRGHNLGGKLIERCLEWGREKGVVIAKLGVATTNTAAIRCYTRLGFSVFGIEPKGNYSGGVYYDELLMALDLK